MKNFKTFLAEGGGFGHLNSPHHLNFSLRELKDIIKNAYEGTLEKVAEKTDGQNLMISWKNGKLIASRNKGQQKNYGESALDKKGIYDMFAGRGELSNAFNSAVDDLESGLKQLSKDDLEYIFKDGKAWASLEIMTPKNENIIHYGVTEIRFHGVMDMGEDGVPSSQLNQSTGRYIAKLLRNVNASIQDTFEIKGLSKIKLDKVKNSNKLIAKSAGDLDRIFKKYRLSDKNGISDYQKEFFKKEYLRNTKLKQETIDALLARWVDGDKTKITNIYKMEDSSMKSVIQGLDKGAKKQFTLMMTPIDRVFLEVGTNVVSNIKTFMSVNPDKAIRQIKDRMKDTTDKIGKSGNEDLKNQLKRQMDRINSIGGTESITPSEGITFFYNGELLKLTGSFAAANQLINLAWKL